MARLADRCVRVVVRVTCVCALGLCAAFAQGTDEPAAPPGRIVIPVDKDAVVAPRLNAVRLNLKLTPELLVFGSSTVDAAAARKRLTDSLANEIRDIDQFCTLTESQKRKLQLAGRRDIHEFFERFEAFHVPQEGALDAEARRKLSQDQAALGKLYRGGMFVDDSLFVKTLRGTLTAEQREQYQRLLRDRRVAIIEAVLSEWDQRALGIRFFGENRRKLAELLVDKSNPPAAWSTHTYHVLLLQMAALETDVRPLFADSEWPALERELKEARELEPVLKQMGVWPVRQPAVFDPFAAVPEE